MDPVSVSLSCEVALYLKVLRHLSSHTCLTHIARRYDDNNTVLTEEGRRSHAAADADLDTLWREMREARDRGFRSLPRHWTSAQVGRMARAARELRRLRVTHVSRECWREVEQAVDTVEKSHQRSV